MHGVKHNLNHISMTHVHELVGALFLFVLYLGSCTKNTTIKIDELVISIYLLYYIYIYMYIICILYIIYIIYIYIYIFLFYFYIIYYIYYIYIYIYNWDHTMQSGVVIMSHGVTRKRSTKRLKHIGNWL